MLARLFRPFMIATLALLFAVPVMAQQGAGTTLRFIPHADLTILDPYWSGVYITRNFGYMIYDTLFSMDGEFRPQPQMARGTECQRITPDRRTDNCKIQVLDDPITIDIPFAEAVLFG